MALVNAARSYQRSKVEQDAERVSELMQSISGHAADVLQKLRNIVRSDGLAELKAALGDDGDDLEAAFAHLKNFVELVGDRTEKPLVKASK